MNDVAHPDEVERLRIALWGPGAASSTRAARHVEACDACAEDVDFHRRLRDTMERLAASEVPAGAMERARDATEPLPAEPVLAWVPAFALPASADVRSSSATELHFVCDARGLRVGVVLHPAGRPGRFALSGQALRGDANPAQGVDVTLYVDRVAAATTTTDAFGEFAFGAHSGSRYGLKLGAGEDAALVEVLPGAGAS